MVRHTDDGSDEANRYGCPECGTLANHPVDARPSAEVEVERSLPDVVFECVGCGSTFDKYNAIPDDGGDDWRTKSSRQCKEDAGLRQVDGVVWTKDE